MAPAIAHAGDDDRRAGRIDQRKHRIHSHIRMVDRPDRDRVDRLGLEVPQRRADLGDRPVTRVGIDDQLAADRQIRPQARRELAACHDETPLEPGRLGRPQDPNEERRTVAHVEARLRFPHPPRRAGREDDGGNPVSCRHGERV